jgi:uncharacterized repeat protein (TIGR01451 family)
MPAFSLLANGPETVTVGETVTLQIRVGNHGNAPLRRVLLGCMLSAGLLHPQGQKIEADLGELPPSQVRTLSLNVQARALGRQSATLKVSAEGGLNTETQTSIMVTQPVMTLKLEGPRDGNLERDLTYQITVVNPGRTGAPGITVTQVLPEGVDFVSASQGGSFDSNRRAITWALSGLPGDQGKGLSFQVRAKKLGDWALVATASGEGMQDVRVTRAIHLFSPPTLTVELSSEARSLAVGAETVFEVRIYNPGSVAAKGMRLTVQLPESLTPINGSGPSKGQLRGAQVLFDPVKEVPGRVDAIYKLRVKGDKPGAGQPMRVSVFAEGMDRPVQQELAITVR